MTQVSSLTICQWISNKTWTEQVIIQFAIVTQNLSGGIRGPPKIERKTMYWIWFQDSRLCETTKNLNHDSLYVQMYVYWEHTLRVHVAWRKTSVLTSDISWLISTLILLQRPWIWILAQLSCNILRLYAAPPYYLNLLIHDLLNASFQPQLEQCFPFQMRTM